MGFGTDPKKPLAGKQYPPTSNDLWKRPMPSSTEYKHSRNKQIPFGSSARTAPVNAPGLEGFSVGGISPGPTGYTPNFFAANKDAPKYTMRKKTKMGMSGYEKRPGPQEYPQPPSIGKQPNARKPSRPQFSFSKS